MTTKHLTEAVPNYTFQLKSSTSEEILMVAEDPYILEGQLNSFLAILVRWVDNTGMFKTSIDGVEYVDREVYDWLNELSPDTRTIFIQVPDKIYSTKALASTLDSTTDTVSQWGSDGHIIPHPLGGKMNYYLHSEVVACLKSDTSKQRKKKLTKLQAWNQRLSDM